MRIGFQGAGDFVLVMIDSGKTPLACWAETGGSLPGTSCVAPVSKPARVRVRQNRSPEISRHFFPNAFFSAKEGSPSAIWGARQARNKMLWGFIKNLIVVGHANFAGDSKL